MLLFDLDALAAELLRKGLGDVGARWVIVRDADEDQRLYDLEFSRGWAARYSLDRCEGLPPRATAVSPCMLRGLL